MKEKFLYSFSKKVEKLRVFAQEPIPCKGWIQAMREALGLTLEQLGQRLEKTYQTIQKLEKTEILGSPTLKTMQEVAAAMQCKFVYAFIPLEPIEQLIDAQATQKITALMKDVEHTMMLENQTLTEEQVRMVIHMVKEEVKETYPTKIWDEE